MNTASLVTQIAELNSSIQEKLLEGNLAARQCL